MPASYLKNRDHLSFDERLTEEVISENQYFDVHGIKCKLSYSVCEVAVVLSVLDGYVPPEARDGFIDVAMSEVMGLLIAHGIKDLPTVIFNFVPVS